MIDQLGLTEFDVFDRWTEAPEGALLQVGYNGLAIGWRCISSSPAADGLLIVAAPDQRDVGLLITNDDDTPVYPAIDVSRVLELALLNPCAGEAASSWRGAVLWDGGAVFVQSTTRDEDNTGYACIRNGGSYRAGHVYRDLSERRLDIGKIGVRRR